MNDPFDARLKSSGASPALRKLYMAFEYQLMHHSSDFDEDKALEALKAFSEGCKAEDFSLNDFSYLIHDAIHPLITFMILVMEQNISGGLREAQVLRLTEAFLQEGGEVDALNVHQSSALAYAAARNYVDLARYLLSHEADPNGLDEDGRTHLHSASRLRSTAMIELFLSQPHFTRLHHQDDGGRTALMEAFDYRRTENAIYLMDHGISLETPPNFSGYLVGRCHDQDLCFAKSFIQAGGTLELDKGLQYNAFGLAATYNNIPLLELLVQSFYPSELTLDHIDHALSSLKIEMAEETFSYLENLSVTLKERNLLLDVTSSVPEKTSDDLINPPSLGAGSLRL